MFKRMSETEMWIMEKLWGLGEPTSVKELESFLLKEKKWRVQTIATFLTRMEEKGFLRSKRKGRAKYYYPIVTKQQYQEQEAKGILEAFYQGSFQKFVTALYGEKISLEKIEEIEKWLEQQKE